jgi:hypothetical protein
MTSHPYAHPAHWRQVLTAMLNSESSRAHICTQLKWDETTLDAVAAGRRGLKIDEIQPFFDACGLQSVPQRLFDAYVEIAKVGAVCALAKAKGNCP